LQLFERIKKRLGGNPLSTVSSPTQYNDFLKANPALAMDPKAAFTQFLMTKSAFAQLGASPVTEKAAGPVRKQP
jgi:hypothetical protein